MALRFLKRLITRIHVAVVINDTPDRTVAPLYLRDGTYGTFETPYQCQFADATRVSVFLDDPASLKTDTHWRSFGFDTQEEYIFWAPRLCGVACLKMALGTSAVSSVADLTQRAVQLGGYAVTDAHGRFVDKGWFYAPLVELAKTFGFTGDVLTGLSLEQLCARVLAGDKVIASVNPRVVRGDEESAVTKGGHLVLVLGFSWAAGHCTGLIVHNPSGRSAETQSRAFVPAKRFEEAYAGRGFVVRAPDPAPDGP